MARHMFHLAAAFLLYDDLRGMIVCLDGWTCLFTLVVDGWFVHTRVGVKMSISVNRSTRAHIH